MWKRRAAALFLRVLRSWLARSHDPFDRVLEYAYDMQVGRLDPEIFRQQLQSYYEEVSLHDLKAHIRFDRKRRELLAPCSYKVDMMDWQSDKQDIPAWMHRLWNRRFAYLRHLGVRCDVLALRADSQIPPHGHNRVISGFYVLEGEVAFQHFDRIRIQGNGLLVRKTIDASCKPGEYSTNSEFRDNIHWLVGVADVSYLFRFTVTRVPGPTFSPEEQSSERIYVDPTGEPDEQGMILARYVSGEEAKGLKMVRTSSQTATSQIGTSGT